jgi:hypothetical protein
MTRAKAIRNIILNYEHNFEEEGGEISKRRLWYILKPQLVRFYNEKNVKNANAEYNKYYNDLAQANLIDDSYILDSSRYLKEGTTYPQIILASEKNTIRETIEAIADKCGFSLYISGGQSSIYASKKLKALIRKRTNEDIRIFTITDYDDSGISISNALKDHFQTNEVERIVLRPDQVPADKINDHFNYSDGLGFWYELDVLNKQKLRSVIAEELEWTTPAVKEKTYEDYLHSVKLQEVENDPEVIRLSEELEAYKRKLYVDSKTDIRVQNFSLDNLFKEPQEIKIEIINN